ncbi:flavin oxidoreductase [Aliidiomarina minuta]|uniref:Flavin oxidoreductase n=1 Tax=Aliidiomarina minuta TaxID=880057 RepID=A0A432WAR2_9GAMM|nr:flavin reductase [Aliidiomarina minuta]RUO26678.1 flavin oxidoreductase [Aliidiomarina minuta]
MQHITRHDLDKLPSRYRAHMINSLSGFKSANLLATADEQGNTNLAMISSVVHLGAEPPLIGFIMRPNTVPRHSLDNIRQTGVFTLNHVHPGMLQPAHQSAAKYEREISEFDATGLTPMYHESFHAPAVTESRVRIGLQLLEIVPIKHNGTEMVIAEICWLNIPANIQQEDGYLDIEEAGSVSVSGLDSYHTTVRINRLAYPKP